ncbi:MAG: UDP-2,4-diacetamido-2,4,6-trideoxy-beta-L-altropyranose hydrolase [Blastochloris sp.]|nr:UDP-2,4-diacetamido-2,4,6-trideoxy-beta-L-altropyranose hydrolase [Blastochloris sp.]
MTSPAPRPSVVFRCDASAEIGVGHVMRCMALGEAFRLLGHSVLFAVTPETLKAAPALLGSGQKFVTIAANADSQQAQADQIAATVERPVVLVVDHYGLDRDFESACRRFAYRVLVLSDGPGRTHDCDVLLDSAREAAPYRGFVPTEAEILAGPSFAPIALCFAQAQPSALRRRLSTDAVHRILVSFGGSDPAGWTELVLRHAPRFGGGIAVDVVLGSATSHLDRLVTEFADRATFHVDTTDMAGLMSRADLAIGACGSSSFERCILGLPTVAVPVASNQTGVARLLADSGAAIIVPGSERSTDLLEDRVRHLIADREARTHISKSAAALVDGRGSQRVALAVSQASPRARLRLAEPADRDLLLTWQLEPGARTYSRDTSPPTEESHIAWFEKTLADPNRWLMIFETNGVSVGSVRLDRLPAPEPTFEVSVLVSEAHRGAGTGTAALRAARKIAAPHVVLIAEIDDRNVASQRAFAAAGFVQTAERHWKSRALDA